MRADAYNETVGSLKGIDCKICRNKGTIAVVDDDGTERFVRCSCHVKRQTMRRMEKSGLKDVITRYTFAAFDVVEPWQREIKDAALAYIQDPKGGFVVTGQSGGGKTHICTAVCGSLIKQGNDVCYMLWRTEAPPLKAYANTVEYPAQVEPYKTVKVLYIDDFWKGKVTDGDINLAFDILNARYNNTDLITILSTELSIGQIVNIDEAVGRRISQRAAYILCAEENWGLRDSCDVL